MAELVMVADMETTEEAWLDKKMIDIWLDKKDVVHIPDRILLHHKKDEILPFVKTWMDLENIMLKEISQREKFKNHMISLICGIYKQKQQMNQKRRTKTPRHR